MRIAIQMSTVPDGGLTRVHLVVTDLDDSRPEPLRLEADYDSGITPPHDEDRVRAYVGRILAQLDARIGQGALIDVSGRQRYNTSATPPR